MVYIVLLTFSVIFCLVGKFFRGYKLCFENIEFRSLFSVKVWCFEGGVIFVRDKIFFLVYVVNNKIVSIVCNFICICKCGVNVYII